MRDLLPPRPQRRLDPIGVATAWGEHPEHPATCFAGIESLPRAVVASGAKDPDARERAGDGWRAPLVAAARRCASRKTTAVAVSGGFDSALALALLRAAGVDDVRLFTVSSGFAGYDETAAARATARAFELPLQIVSVGERDFLAALPACVLAAETALYNLHPVERWLLARAVADAGYPSLVTGDGADQVFAGAPPAIFLPILSALFADAGVRLRSPFLEPEIVARGLRERADPEKTLLRGVARALDVPAEVASRPKLVRLAPPMDLTRHLEPARLAPLAKALGRPLRFETDRERVQWATLGLLWEQL